MIKNSKFLLLLLPLLIFNAFGQASLPFQHPRDQIALQLGAIQMGYGVPFRLSPGVPANAQQAANALVMGRNALDATVSKPAVKVVGAVNSPAVDTVEYRDQLYQAVEAVITSPVVGTIRGSVNLAGGRRQAVTARLTLPPNAYTLPVPYAVESATSVDAQGILSGLYSLPANSIGSLQISPGAIRSIHLAPGALSSMEVVSQNTTALPNRSYFIPNADVTLTLPANPAIGEVVTVYGKGGKVRAASQQGISNWTFRRIPGAVIDGTLGEFTIVCSSDANKIYARFGGRIFGSHDAGKNWSVLKSGDQFSQFDCSDDGSILLVVEEDPVKTYLISRDSGVTWSSLALGSEARESVILSPDGSKIFQVGSTVETGQYADSIKISSDGGVSWQTIPLPPGVGETNRLRLSADGRTIAFFAWELNTLFFSNDMGTNWIDGRNVGLNDISSEYASCAVSRDGQSIVAFDYDEIAEKPERFFSGDGGKNWAQSEYAGSGVGYYDGLVFSGPLVGFQDGKHLFWGLSKSFDKGLRWSRIKFVNDPYAPSLDAGDNSPEFLPICSSFDGNRLIGVLTANEMNGIYTSWSDELNLDGDSSNRLIYVGGGNWKVDIQN